MARLTSQRGAPGSAAVEWRQPGRRARQMRLIPAEALRALYAKSDRHGAWRALAHAALLVIGAALIHQGRGQWWLPGALVLQGLFLASLFAAMHEGVHPGNEPGRDARRLKVARRGAAGAGATRGLRR